MDITSAHLLPWQEQFLDKQCMSAGVWFWRKQQVGVEIRRGRYVVSTVDRSREYRKGTHKCSIEHLCDWGNVSGEIEGEENKDL